MQAFTPLTLGALEAHGDVVKAFTAEGLDPLERTLAAKAFLLLSDPQADLSQESGGAVLKAASNLYLATFARPEDPAPAQ